MRSITRRDRSRTRSAGFTLLELVTVIIIASILAGVLIGRFLIYLEIGEKTAMEQTVGAIRSGLNIQMAGLITRCRMEDIPRLVGTNPMKFLAGQQKNFAGEFYGGKLPEIAPGSWYFDMKDKYLVYLVDRDAHFVPGADGQKWVRFRLSPVFNESFQDGSQKSLVKEIGGVVLEEVEPYKWFAK